MSGGASTAGTLLSRPFAGRDRRFQLRLGEISELERVAGAGIGAITERVITGKFYARDIWDTLRLGLEGGGMDEPEATALLSRYRDKPLIPYVGLASDILAAALAGVPEPPPGKAQAEGDRHRPETSPPSTPQGEP
jgi:hypothetical protein